MKIEVKWSTSISLGEAVEETYQSLIDSLGHPPSLLLVYGSEKYDSQKIMTMVDQLVPGVPLHGGSSCNGVMTKDGFHSTKGVGLGMMGIYDPEGSYGVGLALIEENPKKAGEEAIRQAIKNADQLGIPPELVWVNSAPGHEEDVLLGIQEVIGNKVPIAGGSTADNFIAGKWYQFTNGAFSQNGVVVTAMYPSVDISFSFHSGYAPTDKKGLVTKASGRTLYEIDNKPAAEVYNAWANEGISDFMDGGNILSATSFMPLGRIVDEFGSVPYYMLIHPETVTAEGGITLFANIQEGEKITLMLGTPESLISRAGRTATASIRSGNLTPNEVSGALVVYCAGCMLAIQDEMSLVANEVKKALGNNPFLGLFTFGEQGCFINGENRHGNLMISVVTFGVK